VSTLTSAPAPAPSGAASSGSGKGAAADADSPPTPHYNAAVAEDVLSLTAAATIARHLAACSPAAAALVAVKAWARRRGLAGRSLDALTGFTLSAVVAAQVAAGKLLPHMSPLQATRALLAVLASVDLSKAPVTLTGSSAAPERAGSSSDAASRRGGESDEEEEDDDGGYATGDSDDVDGEEDDDEDEGDDVSDDADDDDMDGGGLAAHFGSKPPASAAAAAAATERKPLTPATVAAHRSAYAVCVLFHDEATGLTVNLASRVSAAVAAELRVDAALLLAALSPAAADAGRKAAAAAEDGSDAGSDAEGAATSSSAPASGAGSSSGMPPEAAAALFERIFGAVEAPPTRYDRLVTVPMPGCPLAHGSAGASPLAPSPVRLTDKPLWAAVVADAAAGVLASALGDRVRSLRVVPVYPAVQAPQTQQQQQQSAAAAAGGPWPQPAPLAWPLHAPPPAPTCLWVCLAVNPREATRNVERGPPPEAVSASAAFTHLWGSVGDGAGGLSELRRFADGSVVNAVVWDAPKLGGRAHARHAIVPLIVAHVLNRHVLAGTNGGSAAQSAAAGAGKKGKAGGSASAAPVPAPTAVDAPAALLPSTLLHAGDHLLVAGAPTAGGAARALLAADVARAVPSLALERALDPSGCITATTTVTAGSSGGVGGKASAVAVASKLSLAPGTALPASVPLPAVMDADPLSKGPAGAFASAASAFEALSLALRNARGLPLKVSAVVPACAALRHTATHAPCPHPLAASAATAGKGAAGDADADDPLAALLGGGGGGRAKPLDADALLAAAGLAAATSLPTAGGGATTAADLAPSASQVLQPLAAVLTLEGSGKWPDDVDAIAALKVAFYLKLKYALTAGVDGSALPRGIAAAEARHDCLRVTFGGYAFALHLHHPRETALLERLARRGPLARPYTPPALVAAAAAGGSGGGAASSSSTAAAPSSAATVRGFVNVAPAGLNAPEEPLSKKQRRALEAANGALEPAHVPKYLRKQQAAAAEAARKAASAAKKAGASSGPMKPLAASDGMAVLRAQLGLPPVAAAAAAGGAKRGSSSALALPSASAALTTPPGGALSPADAGARLDGLFLRCIAAPRHAQAVAALAARFAAYGPTVRLASLWLAAAGAGTEDSGSAGAGATASAALLPPLPAALTGGGAVAAGADDGAAASAASVVAAYHASLVVEATAYDAGAGPLLRHEAVELLVAHLFTDPAPHGGPPGSPSLGLLRFLRLLGRHDWARSPLLVDADISHLLDADEGGAAATGAGAGVLPALARSPAALAAAAADARTLASRFREVRAGEAAVSPAPPGGSSSGGAAASAAANDEESGFSAEASAPVRGPGGWPHGPALYIVTPHERGHWRPLWSRAAPSWPALARLTSAARSAEATLAAALAPVIPAPAAAALPPAAPAGGKGAAGKPLPRHAAFDHASTSLGDLVSSAPSPFAAFGASAPATTTAAAPASHHHALVALKPAVLSRWGVDGRYTGPVKPPVALAAGLWEAPRALRLAASAAAVSADVALADGAEDGAPAKAAAPMPAHLQLVAPSAAKPFGAPKALTAGGKAGGAGGGTAVLVLPGGVPDAASRLTLPLHRNLVARSRSSLCVGFDPLGCYLAALRRGLGRFASFAEVPADAGAVAAVALLARCPLISAATGAAAPTDEAAASALAPSVGVRWYEGAVSDATAAAAWSPSAVALATVPLIASAGAGMVRSVAVTAGAVADEASAAVAVVSGKRRK
jgi:hypothetical protein